jgi:hypothetical protein
VEPLDHRQRQIATARLLVSAGLVLFLGAMLAVILDASSGEKLAVPETTTRAATIRRASPPPPPAAAPRLRAVRLSAVAAYDPEGDGIENDELAGAAVDRDSSTSWRTERYSRFFKDGVGIVFDAHRSTALARVVVSTDTPGFRAEIRVAGAAVGPYRTVSASRTVTPRTRFPLRRARGRFVLVWITDLPDGSAANVSEVRALARSS